MAQKELSDFLLTLSLALLVALIVVPVLVWRIRKGHLTDATKGTLQPARVFCFGIAFFGAMAILAFSIGRPLFGSFFLGGTALCALALALTLRRG